MLGIVQEQHAERARLYKQWQQYKWPIVQDALNLFQIKVVPITVALNEQGVVVSHNARPEFLERWISEGDDRRASDWTVTVDEKLAPLQQQFLWQGDQGLSDAIVGYEKLIADSHADNPQVHFEAAVCYRNRFESDGNPEDFQQAIDHWSRALALDPNQYIYRRRIEQYGARLGKPYPFYDWVEQAQANIRKRGEEPNDLRVEISGAEIAQPLRKFEAGSVEVDWEGTQKINVDENGYVQTHAVVVPASVKPGRATRVHVLISPGENCKWNNQSAPTTMILQESRGVSISQNVFEYKKVSEAESIETRRFEFEVLLDDDAREAVTIRGSVLINICIVDSGICTYLRKPFEITVTPTLKP